MAKNAPSNAPETAAKSDVIVQFRVTRHAAIIGDCHHAAGKLIKLPKSDADVLADLGAGVIEGIAQAPL